MPFANILRMGLGDKMKKVFSFLLIVLAAFVLSSCKKQAELVLADEDKTIALRIGQTATITPALTEGFTLEWESDSAAVATVTAAANTLSATIEAEGVGTATITVSVVGEDVSATITVTVTRPDPTSVAITGAGNVAVESTLQLTGAVSPATADQGLTWTSEDAEIATVSNTGLVTGVGVGTVKITATSTAKNTIKAEVNVTVVLPDPSGITVTGADEIILGSEGATYTAVVAPVLAVQSVVWSVSDTTKASVSAAGLVTPIAAGSVDVIATSTVSSTVAGQKTITIVLPAPTGITVSGPDVVKVGKTGTFTAVVAPALAVQTVTWSTSDALKATVDASGVLTGVAEGTVNVIATSTVLGTIVGQKSITIGPADPVVTFDLNEGYWPITISDEFIKIDPTQTSPVTFFNPTNAEYLAVYTTNVFLIDANKKFTPSKWVHRIALTRNTAGFYEVGAVILAGTDNPENLGTYEYILFAHDGNATGYAFLGGLTVGQIVTFSGFDILETVPGTITGTVKVYPASSAYSNTVVEFLPNTDLPQPTKVEHDFVGWYANAELTGDAVTQATATGTLYAKYVELLPETITVTGQLFLDVAEKATYKASVAPARANQGVTWSTSDITIATIDAVTGELTAVKAGTVDVIATSTKTNTIAGELEVTVYGEPTAITYVGPTEFVVGGSGTAKAAMTAAEGEVADPTLVTYSVDTPAVATIDAASGVVSALTAGTATVTITSTLNNTIVGTQLITVYEATHTIPTTKYIVTKDYADKVSFISELYPGNYIVGYNAFTTLTDALAKAVAGDEITVMAGTYEENVTISVNNLTIKGNNVDISAFDLDDRKEESIISGTITLGDVEGITLDGLQISVGQIRSVAALKDIMLKNLYFVDSSAPAAEGVVFFGLSAAADVNENITVTGCNFNDNKATGYRGVRINNVKNITITDTYFYGFYDTIRLECQGNAANVSDGVQGTAVIEDNKFEMNVQYPIYFTTWAATSVEINRNYIAVDPAGAGTYGFMRLDNYVPKTDVKSVVHIQYNVFPYNTEWHEVRVNSKGATKDQLEVHVNFNEFNEIPWSDETDQCTHIADHSSIASDFIVDGAANFFKYEEEVKSVYFLKTDYNPYYRSEADLETLYVDDDWAGKAENEIVNYDTDKYVFGLNAFATITDALAEVKAGKDIYVLPGTYAEQIEITKVVNLHGPNEAINPVEADTAFLAASETAATVTGVWYLNTVTDVEIKGFSFTGASRVRMYGPSGDAYGFVFENNYVYDTDAATLAWKGAAYSSYGISTINDALTPGFLNLVPYARWLHDFKIVNNKFVNVSDTNVFALCVAGITIEGNYFKDGDRDAIRLDYGSVYGDVNIKNNYFENIALNGVYFRSYTGTYTTALNANIHNNYFKNVGSSAATDASAKIGAISTRGYAEKKDAYFDIRYNVFEDCYNYVTLRANVTNTTTWATTGITWQAKIEYNAFIDVDAVPFYFQNLLNAADSASTNVDNVIINNNFYGTNATTKATITTAQFDLHKTAESNLVVYDTLELLNAAIDAVLFDALKVEVAALAEGKTAEYPAASLDAFLAGHGFSGYTLTHNNKVLFFGYNAYIPLRAMEGEETVLPWQAVQPHTTGDAALVNNGLTLAGPVAAGADPTGTGAMYHNVNDSNIVVNSKELYGYQGSAWGFGLYGVIRVDKNGLIKENIAAASLEAGVLVTLEPGDYLITCFQSDRTALVTAYAGNADFAVGQTVVISGDPDLAYNG